MLKTQLNIDAVKAAYELSKVIGVEAKISIDGFNYTNREEAFEVAEVIKQELNLFCKEMKSKEGDLGWFALSETEYGSNFQMVLFFSRAE